MSLLPLHDKLASEKLYQGNYLTLQKKGSWEFVSRCHVTGTVGILAITENREIILIEQFRAPVNRRVIEIPAGLVGDVPNEDLETLIDAAHRELLEETGYVAESMEYLAEGPSSAGLTTELISFYYAVGLKQVSDGRGDNTEHITVHRVPIEELSP